MSSIMAAKASLSHQDYTVGWICALPLEMAAAKLMLDAPHPSLPRPPTDDNTYILGNIGEHNIVIACLPSGAYGNVSAATVAVQLLSSFPSIRFGLMVGIGGGVPSNIADIRLGDIVVSRPTDTSGGVIQYDLGKALSSGQFQRTGMLNRPPKVLLTALNTLQAHHLLGDNRVLKFISNARANITPRAAANFARPTEEDLLYQTEYNHGSSNTCIDCDRSKLTPRPSRDHKEPMIHYGLIASANQVVKNSRQRDQLAQDLGVYCVEMEAAGLMNDFPCLVVRGICDYADSHKNEEWQGYAAVVAAAYAKELLLVVPIDQVENTPTARDMDVDPREVLILHESATKKRNMNDGDSEGSTIGSDITERKKARLHYSRGFSCSEESDTTDYDGNSVFDETSQENADNIPEPPDASQHTESYASVSERPTAWDETSENGSSIWYDTSPSEGLCSEIKPHEESDILEPDRRSSSEETEESLSSEF
ncbi:hypothetical protein N7467_011733 [Penicillium canescens]|nr:hypothetical protein N7467_011733 [Penicillium canescens]